MPKDLNTPTLAVTIGQHSVAGRKAVNQDFHGGLVPKDRSLTLKGIALAIADGISSSDVSDIASETAVKSFLDDYYCTSDAWSVRTAASRVIAATNSWLYGLNKGIEDRNRGHVTTFSGLVLKGRQAHLFHVGDSRIWRVSGGTLEQLSTDHRVILSEAENYLGRALGLDASVDIDYSAIDLEVGSVLVLTTDGVHDHISPRDIAKIIVATDPDTAARQIVDAALANGSEDNLTIQIVRIDDLPPRDAAGVIDHAETLPLAKVPRVPFELDGYQIQREIHSSSRSQIYLATDSETGNPVALKILSTELREDPEQVRRFSMEEWIARRMNSPYVLRAAPAHEGRTSLYVVTEYVEGQTLRQWMSDNPKPDLETVRGIVEQIARGIQAFHRKDMIHQDLRPENGMIDRDGTVKIIDFGAVRVAGVIEAMPALDRAEILGTHQYTAPEYFLGYLGTTRSDMFALGVMAYEMLTGRLPYGATVARATSEKAQGALRYISASAISPQVPDWIDGALYRAVDINPARRYEVLSEFVADLRAPNPAFRKDTFRPLADRDPVRFWKTLSGLLAILVIFLTIKLLGSA